MVNEPLQKRTPQGNIIRKVHKVIFGIHLVIQHTDLH
jgi:hypothetical protein